MEISKMVMNIPYLGGIKASSQFLSRFNPTNLSYKVSKLETPFDIYIEMVNLMAKFPGMNILAIDRKEGLLITWDEINQLWLDGMRTWTKVPKYALEVLRNSESKMFL